MSEMSDMHKLIMAMKLAKTAQVGMELTYFDVIELLGELDSLKSCITELEAERRWIPVSEPPKECEMRVFKDGNAWCFVLPDFQDLQVSSSVWMKEGVLDKIYKELRSVKNE